MVKTILAAVILCCVTSHCYSQTIINRYAEVVSINIGGCANDLTVDTSTGFFAGDDVLLIQMKGANVDTSNTSSFGTLINLNDCGNYEVNKIKSISGNIIRLTYTLAKTYSVSGRVQIVRIPRYKSYAISTTHTCKPWNGHKGGIFAIIADDTLSFSGYDIDVSGMGFLAGYTPTLLTHGSYVLGQSDYCYPQNLYRGGMKGEGITEISILHNYCRGPLYNGGGGANSTNTGGAGGANGGYGGHGGNEWFTGSNNGGHGGIPCVYSAVNNKIFMGGGGGGGDINNYNDGTGGNGGGLAIVMAGTIIGNNRAIIANGAHGKDCSSTTGACGDGFGGGGAGGTVLINANNLYQLNVMAQGARGANINTVVALHGPGGGGGGGELLVDNPSLLPNINFNLNGGAGGTITYNSSTTNYGTTPGGKGDTASGFTIPVSSILSTGGNFSASVDDTITGCRQLKITALSNSIIVSTKWNFGDGNTSFSNPANNNYKKPGSYTVTLIVNNNQGCIDTITKIINIPPLLVNELVNDSGINCRLTKLTAIDQSGTPINYKWYTGDGDSTTGNNILHSYKTNGSYSVMLIATDSNGCEDTVHHPIKLLSNIHYNISDSSIGCSSAIMTATYSSGSKGKQYYWQLGDGNTSSNNPVNHRYKTPSISYYVSVVITDSLGCTDTFYHTTSLADILISINAGNDTSICFKDKIRLKATGAQQYTWSPLNGMENSTTDTPYVMPVGDIEYYVTGIDSNGCKGRDSVAVHILPLPDIHITADYETITCTRNTVELDAYGGSRYEWGPDGLFKDNTNPHQTVTPTSYTKFYVYGYDANGCWNIATKEIFQDLEAKVFVPGAFSPNYDGLNDEIHVFIVCDFHFSNFSIYNRFGEQMFYTEDIKQGWNGYYKNKLQDINTYYYMVRGTDNDGKQLVMKGDFILLQ